MQELNTNHLSLKNRLILPPMASGKAGFGGEVTTEMLNYYDEKSKGGYLSMIIVEHAFISHQGKASVRQLSIASDDAIEGLKQLAETVHKNGSKVIAQLSHAGGATKDSITGQMTVGPSCVPFANKAGADRELTETEIMDIVKDFADAAERAKKAGFDGVEIHSAHAYLLNQFYSPLTNHRTDQYGGDVKNRLRLHLEVIAALKEKVGNEYPILVRLGACDYMHGGNTEEDALAAVKILENTGIEILDISGGLNGYIVRGKEKEQGYFSDITGKIKAASELPVILTGGITDIEVVNELLKNHKADLIGIGRAMFRDSEWARKALNLLKVGNSLE